MLAFFHLLWFFRFPRADMDFCIRREWLQIIFIIYGKSVHKNECISMHARLVYYVFFRKSRTFGEKCGIRGYCVTVNRRFKISIDLFLTKSGFSFKITVWQGWHSNQNQKVKYKIPAWIHIKRQKLFFDHNISPDNRNMPQIDWKAAFPNCL